jgi:prepilin-type N-terminal cleavage/methylation domain-containing protein
MHRSRAGFTLVEVIVAIVLIEVGLFALVGGSAVLVRQANQLRGRVTAVHAAVDRLQLLSAAPCAVATGIAGATGVMREDWSLALVGSGVREVRDSVTFRLPGGGGAVVLRTRVPC